MCRHYLPACLWWSGILFLAVIFKYHYSTASAVELQWMLRPLAVLVRLLTDLQFVNDGSGEWMNTQNNIAIVKSCAGVNFMILSLCVYAQRLQPVAGSSHRSRRVPAMLAAIVLCLVTAWGAALLVNTVRIIVAIQLYQQEFHFAHLSTEQMHRAAGVLIYFPALWLQFYLFSGVRRDRAGFVSAILYLGLMTVVPLVTGGYRAVPELFTEHVLVTGGLTMMFLALLAYLRPERFIKTSFSNR